MLNLNLNSGDDKIVVTLTEKNTATNPNYHFEFKSVASNSVITIDFTPADDLSNFPKRFNKFSINTSELFNGQEPGQWQYLVTETTTNTVFII